MDRDTVIAYLRNGHPIFPETQHLLSLESADEVLVPEGWHEAGIFITVEGKTLDATVPLGALGPNRDVLPVRVLSVDEKEVGVVLPVGNDGTQTWGIPLDDFLRMLIDPD